MPDESHDLTVPPDAAGARLDRWLADALPLSRAQARRLLDDGRVSVLGQTAKPALKLLPGWRIQVTIPAPVPIAAVAEAIALDVVYEDSDLLVINKPVGMVVHPAHGHPSGTLVNALLAHCQDLSGIGGVLRPGIVHRLDKDTSGLLVVAKHDQAHHHLAAQLQARTMTRRYLAICWGEPSWETITVDQPIGRHPAHRQQMAVVATGRPAVTHFERCQGFLTAALLQAKLATGRTHQVRVHAAWLGHPLLGDPVYGRRREPLSPAAYEALAGLAGQALHAAEIVFEHPRDGRSMRFEAAPAAPFEALLTALSTGRAAP